MLTLEIVPQDMREQFDADVRELTGAATPMPPISEAVMASITSGNDESLTIEGTAGIGYMAVRHVVSPLIIAEDAPPDTLSKILDVFTDQLRTHVREAVLSTHGDAGDMTSERGLSYDVYVPDGQTLVPPDGFEVLPIKVWRRRVC